MCFTVLANFSAQPIGFLLKIDRAKIQKCIKSVIVRYSDFWIVQPFQLKLIEFFVIAVFNNMYTEKNYFWFHYDFQTQRETPINEI
jgi:hypothetical protein